MHWLPHHKVKSSDQKLMLSQSQLSVSVHQITEPEMLPFCHRVQRYLKALSLSFLHPSWTYPEYTVEDIFTHPQTAVARELLKNDVGDDGEEKRGTTAGGKEIIKSGEKIRIVFSENSAFEPVIANLILNFNEPVNILKADTKNVGGVAKGEMVLEFAPDCTKNKEMKQYLLDRGLEIEEVSEHVD